VVGAILKPIKEPVETYLGVDVGVEAYLEEDHAEVSVRPHEPMDKSLYTAYAEWDRLLRHDEQDSTATVSTCSAERTLR
jgi:hypothetical protein